MWRVDNILEVSYYVAVKIADKIFESGLAGAERPDISAFIKSKMYEPKYSV
ncbi:MAG: hypothetical protein ABI729_10275 [Chitinophagales bacterium]